MEGKLIGEIRNFLERGGGTLVWDCQFGGGGFSGRRLVTRAFFLLKLPIRQLRGFCGFGIRRLSSGPLPDGGHFRFIGSSVTGFEMGFIVGVGRVVALTTRPLERRGSTPRPGPSAWQTAIPAILSVR